MTHNDFTVYATVSASELEPSGDNITFLNDEGGQEIMTTTKVIDETDAIMVKGESYVSGDSVVYIFSPDKEIDLWIL